MTSTRLDLRRGLTLVELLVVLAILAVTAMIALQAAPQPVSLTERQKIMHEVAAIRERAVRQGHAERATVMIGGKPYPVLGLADGGVVADTALSLDRFTGSANDAHK
jgi:prepilin-type N-terminal cleavage/methylation domain-containing protein